MITFHSCLLQTGRERKTAYTWSDRQGGGGQGSRREGGGSDGWQRSGGLGQSSVRNSSMSKKLCPSPQRAADLLHGGGFGATPTHSRKPPAFAPPPPRSSTCHCTTRCTTARGRGDHHSRPPGRCLRGDTTTRGRMRRRRPSPSPAPSAPAPPPLPRRSAAAVIHLAPPALLFPPHLCPVALCVEHAGE